MYTHPADKTGSVCEKCMLSKLSRGTSAVDRQAHNLEAGGSIPPPATKMPRSSNGRAAPLHGADGSSILSRGTKG